MDISMDTVSLLVATIVLAVIFVAGLRERFLNMPKWFANPPASFEVIRQQAKFAPRFWIPVQAVFLTALVTAFITNWRYPGVRLYLLLGTVFFLSVIVLTAAYYVKEIMAFQKIPATAPATPELLTRANKWYRTTIVRNILQGIALLFFILACSLAES